MKNILPTIDSMLGRASVGCNKQVCTVFESPEKHRSSEFYSERKKWLFFKIKHFQSKKQLKILKYQIFEFLMEKCSKSRKYLISRSGTVLRCLCGVLIGFGNTFEGFSCHKTILKAKICQIQPLFQLNLLFYGMESKIQSIFCHNLSQLWET